MGNEAQVQPLVTSLIRQLRRLVERTGHAVTRLSDEADEIWEPFLVDEPAMVAAAVRTEA